MLRGLALDKAVRRENFSKGQELTMNIYHSVRLPEKLLDEDYQWKECCECFFRVE